MLRLQVLHDNRVIRSKLLPLLVVKDLIPQVLLVDQVLRTHKSNHEAINANASVQEQEENEVLVVVKADAVVDPDAMMVEFLNANIAKCAVL